MALKKKRQQRGIHLVKPKSNDPEILLQEAMADTYKTGDMVPHSGIYNVSHNEHRLPHEVTLIRESQANFAKQKAAHRMTTAYGMTYSPHYSQKSREQKT